MHAVQPNWIKNSGTPPRYYGNRNYLLGQIMITRWCAGIPIPSWWNCVHKNTHSVSLHPKIQFDKITQNLLSEHINWNIPVILVFEQQQPIDWFINWNNTNHGIIMWTERQRSWSAQRQGGVAVINSLGVDCTTHTHDILFLQKTSKTYLLIMDPLLMYQ